MKFYGFWKGCIILNRKISIKLDNKYLQYCGRIDKIDTRKYCFVYPYSSLTLRARTTSIAIVIENMHEYWDNSLGYVIDGVQGKVSIGKEPGEQSIVIQDNMEDKVHDIIIFKRQDSCHQFYLKDILMDEDSELLAPPAMPKRRIEVYGDSVSAGEVSEAVDYVGKQDPDDHEGRYSNSWYSYAAIAARKLGASLHDIAQGGIALLPDTGWFQPPNYMGMEQMYDKVQYNPFFGESTSWDFSQYTPHVVIVAIGQNDSHPEDYMKEVYDGARAIHWRKHYRAFVEGLRERYPDAHIILTTTILNHDESWDKAIDSVCELIHDDKITHFLYQKNGCGTPGHIRIPEAEQMAEELVEYITSLGEKIWE